MSPRFAVIDVGSNTVHLLIAGSDGSSLSSVDDRSETLRLGADVERWGAFEEEKIVAATHTVQGYVERARQAGAQEIRLLGTQAVRAATNGWLLGERIQLATALPLQVISPSIEGWLGYLGANAEATGLTNLVFDIGGGSTQVLVAGPAGQPLAVHSLPLGSVTAPARFFRNDPPTIDEREALEAAVRHALASIPPYDMAGDADRSATLIGGMGRRLQRTGSLGRTSRLHRHWVEQLADAAAAVGSRHMETFGAIRPGDADMIRSGSIILRELMRAFDVENCIVSKNGIREGAVLLLAQGKDPADDIC